MRWAAKILGALSGVLLLILLLGFLLPGKWVAESDTLIQAPVDEIFPLLDSLGAWALWSPMPESGLETFGSPRGLGAGLRWDDPQYGDGEVRITASEENSLIGYLVQVEGGSLQIRGTLTLRAEGGGSRIHWREEGDFGWNPLLGFAARGMASSQGEAMKESLKTLDQVVTGQAPNGP